ncbi:DUF1028 domain-containing protein [Actinomadura chibensis]|uniref:DUF1028 domain-containing protein n=1 Tax=Actinomadura chibensis TaxID=392828 RepID=A0A5D0NQK2_9ACTN|nr:DUF1028 domain-containing protein [Actinomadura chibensis]TYB46351.1 DUF1028 domain-containing protein [Actinomadura chibensis]
MTFSIIGMDPATGHLGFASQSHFFGVGAVVGRAEAGVGAVVSQAFANTDWPHLGLDGLRAGQAPAEIVAELVAADPLADYRQLLVMDAAGEHAAHTGGRCAPETGGAAGPDVIAAGNMLAAGDVADAMVAAAAEASAPLAHRLVRALAAAEAAGGDARGSQSACVTVVGGERSATPWREVLVDVRVDDHPDPVGELARLLPVQEAFGVVGATLFAPPLVIGDPTGIEDGAEAATAALAGAAGKLGANREADLWRAVVLIRSGAAEEGARLLDELTAARPALAGFVAGLARVGILP